MSIFSEPKFLKSVGYGPDASAVGMTTIDINGDGYLDVVTGYTQGMSGDDAFKIEVLINNKDGTFRYATNKEFGGPLPEIQSSFRAAVADFNGDGKTDIFYACYGFDGPVPQLGEVNHLLLSSGNKLLEAPAGYLPSRPDVTHGVAWGDIDGDHDVDIYVSNVGVENQYFLLNDGTGRFTRSDGNVPAYYSDITQSAWTSELLADLDDDGDLDLWMGVGHTDIGAHVLRNDGTGQFESATALKPNAVGDVYAFNVQAIDLNHDGLLDVMQTAGGDGHGIISVYINQGGMTFADETSSRLFGAKTNLGYGVDNIHFADFNGDGAKDFVIESNYGDFQIMLNNGDGVFFKPKDGNVTNRGGNIAVGDFNKDGHPDILQFVGGGPTELSLFEWEHGPTYPLVGTRSNDKLFGDAKGNKMDGAAGKDVIRSGSGNDSVRGGGANDKIEAGTGKDTVDGGSGKDTLTGGAGADKFVFSVTPGQSNADTVVDFVHGVDKIVLDDVYNPITGSRHGLKASQFYAGEGASAAHDKSDRVIYDTLSGKLFFDKDGEGGLSAKLIATLTGNPVVDATDFIV